MDTSGRGALVAHPVGGALAISLGTLDLAGLITLGVIMVLALVWLARRVAARDLRAERPRVAGADPVAVTHRHRRNATKLTFRVCPLGGVHRP
jgi:hypothetical protein